MQIISLHVFAVGEGLASSEDSPLFSEMEGCKDKLG